MTFSEAVAAIQDGDQGWKLERKPHQILQLVKYDYRTAFEYGVVERIDLPGRFMDMMIHYYSSVIDKERRRIKSVLGI